MTDRLYRTSDVTRLLGVSRRQLQYWALIDDLVGPSQRTRGGHWRYDFEDLVYLRAIKCMRDHRVSFRRIRRAIRSLRRVLATTDRPLAELVLVVTPDVVALLRPETEAIVAVSDQDWVIDVGRFLHEIDPRSGIG